MKDRLNGIFDITIVHKSYRFHSKIDDDNYDNDKIFVFSDNVEYTITVYFKLPISIATNDKILFFT